MRRFSHLAQKHACVSYLERTEKIHQHAQQINVDILELIKTSLAAS